MSIYTMRTKLGTQIKWLLGIVAISVMVGAFYQFGPNSGGPGSGSQSGAEVVATVNGLDITRLEFENAWQPTQANYEQAGIRSPFMLANARAAVFSQLVMSKFELSVAQQEKVAINKREVNKEIDKLITEFLEADRERTLGNISDEQKKIDPRKDEAYIKELRANQTNIAQREDFARRMIPVDQVRQQIARKGLQEKIGASLKPVTDEDVKASYNEYKATLILLLTTPDSPKEQAKKKADNIRKEAVGGADFKVLAKTHDQSGLKENGSQITYSFDMPTLPDEIANELKRLKPGQVSEVVTSDFGYAIVKLDSVTPKLPEKLDKKAMDERRGAMVETQQQKALSELMKKKMESMTVEPKDPELKAYWVLTEAQQNAMGDEAKYKEAVGKAITSLKEAIVKRERDIIASAKLAELYFQNGNFKDASLTLTGMLSYSENAELRKMLGDAQVKLGEKDAALENYNIAASIAEKNDPDVLRQLTVAYTQLGRQDLAKDAETRLADYEKRKALFEAQQQENAPKPEPAPASKP